MNEDVLVEMSIKPALKMLGHIAGKNYDTEDAIYLLLTTAAHESHLGFWLKQQSGPAVGVFQMEPATYEDIIKNVVIANPRLLAAIGVMFGGIPDPEQMMYDHHLSSVMTRLHYSRFSEALPSREDLPSVARYWKKYYNTELGKGTVESFMADCERLLT